MTTPDRIVVPTREDPLVAAASRVVGGPLGRYARGLARGWRWYAAVLAALTAIPLAGSTLLQGYCAAAGWRSPDQFFHMCFTDLTAQYSGQGLGAGAGAWLAGGDGAPTPTQPPLTALVMTLLGGLVPGGNPDDQARSYLLLWVVLVGLLAPVVTAATAAATRDTPWRAAHVALSPVLLLTALLSPDIVGVALASLGLWAWARRRPLTAGVLLGLAISARTYPVVIVLAIVIVAVRGGRLAPLRPLLAGVLAAVAVVVGGIALLNPTAAVQAYAAWGSAGAGYGSPWVAPQLVGSPLPPIVVTILAVLGWIVAVTAGVLFGLGSARRPALAEVALVMLAIVLATGKSFPVQSSLWLVPLVALCGVRWRDHLLWAGAEAIYWGGTWLYIAGVSVPDRGLPAGWYLIVLLLRVAGIGWLVVQVALVARTRDPELTDPQEPDQLAGPVSGAPDRLVVEVR